MFTLQTAAAPTATLTLANTPTSSPTPSAQEIADEYFVHGLEYQDEGKWDMAIDQYSEAITIDPELIEAYYNRANAYSDKGDFDLAIADFDKDIELNPKDAQSIRIAVLHTAKWMILIMKSLYLSSFSGEYIGRMKNNPKVYWN